MPMAELDTDAGRDPIAELADALAVHRRAFRADPYPSYEVRRAHLVRLLDALLDRREEIADAVRSDYGARSKHESTLAEVFIPTQGIRHTLRHLKRWMKHQRRPVAAMYRPARAQVVRQPLGVIGVISPWNYPVQLAIMPLVAALAAGNRAMLKPSELTPATSELLADLLSSLFPSDLVSVHTGGPEVGAAFAALPLDHLFYTGSTHVGRLVMKAAANNLTPVTLELGGKSPAIVHPSFPVARAAERIASGKLFNAGQTCVAPDYVLVHADQRDALVSELKAAVAKLYPTFADNPDYTSIINGRHRSRLEGYLADAAERGATVVELGPTEELQQADRRLAPRLVLDPTDDMRLMQDEIFGPILPIVVYRELAEALDYVNDRPRPLALYYFDHSAERIQHVLEHTTSGGVTVNDTLLHVVQEDLPFGGVGPSGTGAYHGETGFRTFSHDKGVFRQARINGTGLISPPYGRTFERLIDVAIKF